MSFEPLSSGEVSEWHGDFDVIVVGFGGAGACAAIEAARAGSRVMIVEAASAAGGSTALSSAELYLGGGTHVQEAVGYADTPEAMFEYLMASNGPQADAEKIQAYAAAGPEHLDWLASNDVPFKQTEYPHRAMVPMTDDCLLFTGSEKAWPFSQVVKPAPRGHSLAVKGDNGGPLLMEKLAKAALTAGVEVHYETRALKLIVDQFGPKQRVEGLVVREDMQQRCYRAKAGVVLCAGGFVMNESMVQQYAPALKRATIPIGNPNDTGSGIRLGQSVGAATINMHEGFVSLPFYPPASLTFGILVNGDSRRFINEDAYHGRVGAFVLEQLGPVYLIVSVADYADYEQVSYLGAPVAGTGESLGELAEELQLSEDQLAAVVAIYNTDAKAGMDTQFHKAQEWLRPLEPPYVALNCTPGHGAHFPYFTLGGLDTTVDDEVLSVHGNTIPGLYAAGRTACGVPRRGAGYASGISIGDATWSGRQAGKAVSRDMKGDRA